MEAKQRHIGLVLTAIINALLLIILLAAIIPLTSLMLNDRAGDPMTDTGLGPSYGLVKDGWRNDGGDYIFSIGLVGVVLVVYTFLTTFFYRRYVKTHDSGKTRLFIKSTLILNIMACLYMLIFEFVIYPNLWQ